MLVRTYLRMYMCVHLRPPSHPTYLICSMSCRSATLTCTASAWTHSRQNGQQNTESCGLGRPDVRRPLKHGRQNVCPHGVETGTRVSPSSSRKQIGHSQAVRSSILSSRHNSFKSGNHQRKRSASRCVCSLTHQLIFPCYATFPVCRRAHDSRVVKQHVHECCV